MKECNLKMLLMEQAKRSSWAEPKSATSGRQNCGVNSNKWRSNVWTATRESTCTSRISMTRSMTNVCAKNSPLTEPLPPLKLWLRAVAPRVSTQPLLVTMLFHSLNCWCWCTILLESHQLFKPQQQCLLFVQWYISLFLSPSLWRFWICVLFFSGRGNESRYWNERSYPGV